MGRTSLSANRQADGILPGHDGERDDAGTKDLDIDALRDENARLRELVVQLSTLVIKNILERK